MSGADLSYVLYLILALVLVLGAGFGVSRMKYDRRRMLPSIALWLGLIAVVALVYAWIR